MTKVAHEVSIGREASLELGTQRTLARKDAGAPLAQQLHGSQEPLWPLLGRKPAHEGNERLVFRNAKLEAEVPAR